VVVGFRDRMKQAQDAMQQANSPEAQQAQAQAMSQMGAGAFEAGGDLMADRGTIEAQASEFQRINSIGQPGKALIKQINQTSESVAGLPVWEIDIEVRIEGQDPYDVKHREIAAPQSVQAYPVGGEWNCRVDPADPQKVSLWVT
jgi:hypothetical protein